MTIVQDRIKIRNLIYGVVLLFTMLSFKSYGQVLETEESKPLLPGEFEVGTGLEFQTSAEGTESALPIAIEYGLSKKFTLLVEPVAYTNISPKLGKHATGIGDVELTVFYQITPEKKTMPSISISGEIKIPTTKNPLIGTGKTDYTPYLILSKNIGKFFTSVNLSYTILGIPDNIVAGNLFNYAAGTIYKASTKNILFGEVYGNTSASGEGSETQGSEISGGELVGSLGYGYYIKKELLLSFGISYDNNNAFLFRPGIEWKFGKTNSF